MMRVCVFLLCCAVGLSPSFTTAAQRNESEGQLTYKLLVFLPEKPGIDRKLPFGMEMCGAAVWAALKRIKYDNLLPNVQLEANFQNSFCNSVLGLGTAYESFHKAQYLGVIGLQCSRLCMHVGRLASYLRLPVFSGLCQAADMDNKNEFQTLTRFLASFKMTSAAVFRLMRHFGWTQCGLIAERQLVDYIWTDTYDSLVFVAPQQNVTINAKTIYYAGDAAGATSLENILLRTAQRSRIIVLCLQGYTLRDAMLIANKHDLLNGDYIFIVVQYYKQRRLFGRYEWKQNDINDDIIRKAYKSVFFINYATREETEEYAQFAEIVKTQAKQQFGFEYMPEEEVPYPALNIYEATYLYAYALNETLEEGGDPTTDLSFARRLWGRSFPSITGGVTLNANGDREQVYLITHLRDDSSEDLQIVGTYFNENQTMVMLPADEILWPGGRVPPDAPPCGFDNEFCEEDEYAALLRIVGILVGVVAGILATSIVVIVLVYRHMKWIKQLSDMRWKVDYHELLVKYSNKSNTSMSSIGAFSHLSLVSAATTKTADQSFMKTAIYKGQSVALKSIKHIKTVDLSNKKFLEEMILMHDLVHGNICKFIGVCFNGPVTYILSEYCVKGSLQDFLENDSIDLDWTFKCSLMNDITTGLGYLHNSFLQCHGNLKSSNCVVDSRFVVKLTDFGMHEWHQHPDKLPKDYLWTAPELLKSTKESMKGTAEGDIYSLGIILQEIVCREGVFYTTADIEVDQKMENILKNYDPPFRPTISDKDCAPDIANLMKACWSQEPKDRPSLSEVKNAIRAASGPGGKNVNLVENLLSRMEQYANNLEGLVEERTMKYMEEKKKAEDLLHRLLPASVAVQLQSDGHVSPETYESVSIYFSDIVHFTALCSESTPMEVVAMLNDLYTLFDRIIGEFDVYKVETIGDAYMAVSGLPIRNGNRHVAELCKMALVLLANVAHFKVRHKPDREILLRIGIHTGPCVAGVVGLTMPRYCLFGDTVNTASRMESNGEALKIHISATTHEMLLQHEGFDMEYRGEVPMKGKGMMKTYWLLSGPKHKAKNIFK